LSSNSGARPSRTGVCFCLDAIAPFRVARRLSALPLIAYCSSPACGLAGRGPVRSCLCRGRRRVHDVERSCLVRCSSQTRLGAGPAHAGGACATSWCWREPGNDQRRAILLRRCGRVELVRVTECSTPSCRRGASSSTSASICSRESLSMWPSGAAQALVFAFRDRCRECGATTLIWQTARENLRARPSTSSWAPCARSGSTTRWRSEGRLTRAPVRA
jgi:hypothetical protein